MAEVTELRRLDVPARGRVQRDGAAVTIAVLGLLARQVPGHAVDLGEGAGAEPLETLGAVHGVAGRHDGAVRVEGQMRDARAGRIEEGTELVVEEDLDGPVG